MRFIALLLLIILLNGCNSSKKELIDSPEPEPVATREAVFTYGSSQAPSKIVLRIGGEPAQAGDLGFIRLQGVIWDERPEAVVEVSGKGQPVSIGSRVGIYNVIAIKENSVCLKR